MCDHFNFVSRASTRSCFLALGRQVFAVREAVPKALWPHQKAK